MSKNGCAWMKTWRALADKLNLVMLRAILHLLVTDMVALLHYISFSKWLLLYYSVKFRQTVWTVQRFEFQRSVTSDLDLLAMEMIISTSFDAKTRTIFVYQHDRGVKKTAAFNHISQRWQWFLPGSESRNPTMAYMKT